MEFEMEALIPLLKDLTDRYTGKESTSVTYEKARQLMEAVVYCTDAGSMVLFGEGRCLHPAAEWKDARQAYAAGYETVIERTRKAKELYHTMLPHFDDYGNRALKETFLDGMSGFFRYYDPRFNPQDHILTLDYPVLTNLEGQCGIQVIWNYLMCIKWEQTFLSGFPREFVREMLEAYHNQYKGLFINLASVVLRHVLVSLMAGERPQQAPVGRDGMEAWKEYLTEDRREAFEQGLCRLLEQLVQTRYEGEDGLLGYLKQDIHPFAVQSAAVFL